MPAPDDHFSFTSGAPPVPGTTAAVDGNGHRPPPAMPDDAGSGGGRHRRRGPGPTVWPATIVIGVALVVLVGGAVAAVFSTGPPTSGSGPPAVKTAPGSPVAATAAAGALAPIVSPGRPPANVLDAVVVPAGSSVVRGSAIDQSVGLYDRSLGFSTSVSEADVISFYRAELPAQGWRIISQGPPHTGAGFEVLAKLAGTDGYYWELGVTVSPTTFASGAASSGTQPTGAQATPFTVRLFAVSDAA